jgi:hypothetical protein
MNRTCFKVNSVDSVDSANGLSSPPGWKPPAAAGGMGAVRTVAGRDSRWLVESLDGKNILREHFLGRRA